MSWAAKTIVISCFLWVLSFAFLGGGRWGKDAFTSMSSHLFADAKGGVPVLMLAFPILLAGTIASMFATTASSNIHLSYGMRCRLLIERVAFKSVVLCIFLSCAVYVAASTHRHLHGKSLSASKNLGAIANAFGMMAVVVLSWLLIPVSRLGPIGYLFGWDTIQITLIHIWSGRLLILGATLHGSFYIIRWLQQGENASSLLIPPTACWKDSTFQPKCQNPETVCNCYHHWRNASGLLALIALLLIGLSSLERVRRHAFSSFSIIHGCLTPVALLAILMHYNKAFLYAAGGLLYYSATSFPVWIERFRQQPIELTSVERLISPNRARPCVSLTMRATDVAIQRYRSGLFCYLKVPSISKIAHPFTVNLVPNCHNQIRIIFRAVGPFTQSLESQLMSSSPPKMFVHGYYGSGRLLERVQRHDVAIMIAAGIGITPYLSLLREVANLTPADSTKERRIVLHWICGDSELMNFCHHEYFQEMHQHGRCGNLSIEVHLHKTRSERDPGESANSVYADGPTEIDTSEKNPNGHVFESGAPFSPTVFTPRALLRDNLCNAALFASMAWGGLFCVWFSYVNVQHTHEVKGRLFAAFVVAGLFLLISVIANIYWEKRMRLLDGSVWTAIADQEEDPTKVQVSEGVEMTRCGNSTTGKLDGTATADTLVVIKESFGRPSVPELLEGVGSAAHPGIFCCLPANLSRKVHKATKQEFPRTAVYMEYFHV